LRRRLSRRYAEENRAPAIYSSPAPYYGYAFEQMDQERKTQHGRRSPRAADIVIWQKRGR
jgi:hypothetical protein